MSSPSMTPRSFFASSYTSRRRAISPASSPAGTSRRRALLRSLGAAYTYDSRTVDFAAKVRANTGGRGVDIVLNSLAHEMLQASLRGPIPATVLKSIREDEFTLDPTRMTLVCGTAGFDGTQFKGLLASQYDIQLNKTSRNSVLLQSNINNTRSDAAQWYGWGLSGLGVTLAVIALCL